MTSAESLLKKPVEDKIDTLLAQMTLEEKIGQMNQIHPFEDNFRDATRQGLIGSIINATGPLTGMGAAPSTKAELSNEIQRIAVTETRLGIPVLFGRDVIHGYRTVFPIPLGQAASWDADLVEKAAAIAANEASADGIKWTFTPMLDIARDPRWGRIAEGFGEDPTLASTLAAAAVRGYQGSDFANPQKLIACAKHFVGYGGAEGGRDYDGVELSTRTLRDIYLPPFHAAVNAGVATIMSAFHDLNGMPLTANRWLLTEVLKSEWGFKGFVISDWNAIAELVNHGVAADVGDAGAKALHAGVDMDMVAGVYLDHLAIRHRKGQVGIEEIDEAVRRILRIKYLAGLFDHPYTDPERAQKTILTSENRTVARQLAQESIVLLKNEGNILPLGGGVQRITIVGPLVNARSELFGTWTLDGRAEDAIPVAEAIQQNAPKDIKIYTADHVDAAIRLTQYADVVVVILGEHPVRSGENSNVTSLELPPGQREFLEAVADQGTPIVLVVVAGRPLAITREVRLSKAVLYAWHPGIEGGGGIADLLFGYASPSARLPVTIPRATGQVPIYYNHKNSGRPPGQGEFLMRYVDQPLAPLFPFGYGLSYSRFTYANFKVAHSRFKGGQNQISAEITNNSKLAGTEVVQLYVRDLVGSVTRPVKELKGFQRVSLQPGETQQVIFNLTTQDLVFTGLDDRSTLEPGDYHVWIGPNSAEGLHGSFSLVG